LTWKFAGKTKHYDKNIFENGQNDRENYVVLEAKFSVMKSKEIRWTPL
jgi:hypothetical protein